VLFIFRRFSRAVDFCRPRGLLSLSLSHHSISIIYIYTNRPLVPLLIEPRRVNSVVSLQMIYLARKNATSFCRRRWRRLCMTFRTCRPTTFIHPTTPTHTKSIYNKNSLVFAVCPRSDHDLPSTITNTNRNLRFFSAMPSFHKQARVPVALESNFSFDVFYSPLWDHILSIPLTCFPNRSCFSIGGYPSGYLFSPELWCAYVVNLKKKYFLWLQIITKSP